MIEKEFTLQEIANILNIDISNKCDVNIDELGLEIETPNGYKQVSEFYVKEKTIGYQLGNLLASGEHKTLVDNKWIALKDNKEAVKTNNMINVVDLYVPDGNCYIANGHINHNTTPGGW